MWLIGVGIVMAAAAAVIGLIDFLGDPAIRAQVSPMSLKDVR